MEQLSARDWVELLAFYNLEAEEQRKAEEKQKG